MENYGTRGKNKWRKNVQGCYGVTRLQAIISDHRMKRETEKVIFLILQRKCGSPYI